MKAIAPGKIILSGEHAVVYGRPALVMAVNRYAETTITAAAKDFHLHLVDYNQTVAYSHAQLQQTATALQARYELFLSGQLPISAVLTAPEQPFAYLLHAFLQRLAQPITAGLQLHIRSEIPIGCGMGSSAATLVSMQTALAGFCGLPCNAESAHALALEAEKLQHGYPSGVDPYIAAHGGFARFQAGRATPIQAIPPAFTLVHTGAPACSSGECVAQVAIQFKSDPVWHAFESVTCAIEAEIIKQETAELVSLMRENHRLLQRIGVVPDRVAHFIAEIEKSGGAAKISGAGAVRGDAAGMVMVLSDMSPDTLCRAFGYEQVRIRGEMHGSKLV